MLFVRRFGRALAIATLGLLVIVGCTMVGDQLTGVRVQTTDAVSCVKDCNDAYKVLYAQEQARHIAAVEACKAFADDARNACLEAEAVLHEANKESLSQGKTDCQNNCHRQGTGSGG